jgi:hypothetical protein
MQVNAKLNMFQLPLSPLSVENLELEAYTGGPQWCELSHSGA